MDMKRSMHPGATSEQIGSYIDWWLTNYRPNRLVLCAGANDLLYENRRCLENREDLCNETDIVDKVIKALLPLKTYRLISLIFGYVFMIGMTIVLAFL